MKTALTSSFLITGTKDHESARERQTARAAICSGGFLVKKNKFLFGKRSISKHWAPGLWDIVGGHSLKNEHPLFTLQRETFEETGVKVMNAELLTTADICDQSTGEVLFSYYIYMVTNFKGKAFNKTTEHTKLKWFTREELGKLELALPEYLALIDVWLAGKSEE